MRTLLLTLLLIPLLLCSACRVIPPDPVQDPEAVRNDSAEIAVGNKFLKAMQTNDFRMFSECLKNGPAAQMTLQDFKTSRKNMTEMFGKMISFEFLTSLKTPAVKNLIWKITFRKTGRDGREITQQVLFRLITGTDEGEHIVLSFGFV